jgi:CRP-like cAMP-binding protein
LQQSDPRRSRDEEWQWGLIDSAMALAHSSLFSGLSRTDLAKLAGELEELAFTRGAYVVREGDPGDGHYLIKSGEAEVFVGQRPQDGSVLLLRADDGFGTCQ